MRIYFKPFKASITFLKIHFIYMRDRDISDWGETQFYAEMGDGIPRSGSKYSEKGVETFDIWSAF
jgi:hypothetical protein